MPRALCINEFQIARPFCTHWAALINAKKSLESLYFCPSSKFLREHIYVELITDQLNYAVLADRKLTPGDLSGKIYSHAALHHELIREARKIRITEP